jgi:hypothetical protein
MERHNCENHIHIGDKWLQAISQFQFSAADSRNISFRYDLL